jgi:hypothetical protein
MEEKWKQNTKYNELKKRSKIAKKKKRREREKQW